jgi:hypothetical protein
MLKKSMFRPTLYLPLGLSKKPSTTIDFLSQEKYTHQMMAAASTIPKKGMIVVKNAEAPNKIPKCSNISVVR